MRVGPVLASLLLVSLGASCRPREAPLGPRDAAVDAAPDAPRARARRRRPGRSRPRVVASSNGAPQGPTEPPEDPGMDPPEEPAPRPRMTETGPMLPQDLGPPPAVVYDLGSGSDGPMGLEPSQVSRGLNPLLGRLERCAAATGDERGPHGRVSVRLRIRNDGTPLAARCSGGGGPPEFLVCVRRVIASARFAAFRGPDAFASWGFDVD